MRRFRALQGLALLAVFGLAWAPALSGNAADGDPDGDRWLPNECDARIRNTWFWRTDNAATLKSVEALMEMYERSVGHGAVLLLNHTPDPTGAIPEADARRAAEFGADLHQLVQVLDILAGERVLDHRDRGGLAGRRIDRAPLLGPDLLDHDGCLSDVCGHHPLPLCSTLRRGWPG